MKKIVLFDMDGTLTPHRKKMTWKIVSSLTKLQNSGYEIGIITGSDMDYIKQQCDILWDLSPVDYRSIHYLPCNCKCWICFVYVHEELSTIETYSAPCAQRWSTPKNCIATAKQLYYMGSRG